VAEPRPRAALLTVSSSKARGEGADESGERMAELATRLGLEVAAHEIVSDDREAVEAWLRLWADQERVDLILTSGGTGLTRDDVTPEATRAVIEREAPGIAEAIRLASRDHTPHWMLSRGVAGTHGRTLIINFPGSPSSIVECGETLALALPHALALISGERPAHDLS
jgi:molybdenum cofactor synthesis domain-containing protein